MWASARPCSPAGWSPSSAHSERSVVHCGWSPGRLGNDRGANGSARRDRLRWSTGPHRAAPAPVCPPSTVADRGRVLGRHRRHQPVARPGLDPARDLLRLAAARGGRGGLLGGVCFIAPGLVAIVVLSALLLAAIRRPRSSGPRPGPGPRWRRSPYTRGPAWCRPAGERPGTARPSGSLGRVRRRWAAARPSCLERGWCSSSLACGAAEMVARRVTPSGPRPSVRWRSRPLGWSAGRWPGSRSRSGRCPTAVASSSSR